MIPAPFHWWIAYAKWWANFWGRVLSDRPYPGCDMPRPEPRAMTAPVKTRVEPLLQQDDASDWDGISRDVVVQFRRAGKL